MASKMMAGRVGEELDGGRHEGVTLDTIDGTYMRAYGDLWKSIVKEGECVEGLGRGGRGPLWFESLWSCSRNSSLGRRVAGGVPQCAVRAP